MSGPVDLGQTYRYRYTVADSGGTPANAGTVAVTITLPDGTTTAPSVVNSSTGVYDISYTTTQAGLHNVFGSATGGVLSSEFDKWEDAFVVETQFHTFIGLDEASAHLRAGGVITTVDDREQLRWLCMVACDAVERDLGRVFSRRSITDTYDGGRTEINLRSTPVISVTTLTESGSTVAAGGYVLDLNAGILIRGTTTYQLSFASGRQNITVVYVAGYVDPPRAVREVALALVQSLWQQSQQASHPLLDESAELALPSAVAGLPEPLRGAYKSLKAPGFG